MKYPDFSESKLQPDVLAVAAEAGWQAYNRAMVRLGKVVKSQDGQVVEAKADGSVKTLFAVRKAGTVIAKGLVLKRRPK